MEIEYLLNFLSIKTYIETSLGINNLCYSSYGNRVPTKYLLKLHITKIFMFTGQDNVGLKALCPPPSGFNI